MAPEPFRCVGQPHRLVPASQMYACHLPMPFQGRAHILWIRPQRRWPESNLIQLEVFLLPQRSQPILWDQLQCYSCSIR